ncbi:hypothetical protein G5I_12745 [Acromyrmex echinatior]|uniref:Uncharacterized protein n=1 Tax=Acromyrmex echinatior TaxID=103372 RepID=F4X354_ACREC|nr:hypothetical protein G5I_12745 [Acromyrmex echinatior]
MCGTARLNEKLSFALKSRAPSVKSREALVRVKSFIAFGILREDETRDADTRDVDQNKRANSTQYTSAEERDREGAAVQSTQTSGGASSEQRDHSLGNEKTFNPISRNPATHEPLPTVRLPDTFISASGDLR